MDKVLTFGKKYGAWIAGGIVAAVAAVATVVAVRSAEVDEEEYILAEVVECEEGGADTDEPSEPESTEES